RCATTPRAASTAARALALARRRASPRYPTPRPRRRARPYRACSRDEPAGEAAGERNFPFPALRRAPDEQHPEHEATEAQPEREQQSDDPSDHRHEGQHGAEDGERDGDRDEKEAGGDGLGGVEPYEAILLLEHEKEHTGDGTE